MIYTQRGFEHPTNAAELTNTTAKTLDGGPITVYDAGAYGGEALMETLKAGGKRLISYAVDLGTPVTEAFGSRQAVVREIHASRGVLTTKLEAEETRTYTARNVDQKAKTLIVEHALRQGYALLNQNSATARGQLQRIADQKSQIAENERAATETENQIRDLTADEDRLRRNIQSLNAVSGQQQQVQNYARQLDTHEQQFASLRDRQAELGKKKTELESELSRSIEALAF